VRDFAIPAEDHDGGNYEKKEKINYDVEVPKLGRPGAEVSFGGVFGVVIDAPLVGITEAVKRPVVGSRANDFFGGREVPANVALPPNGVNVL
jgi:hypothetical protein